MRGLSEEFGEFCLLALGDDAASADGGPHTQSPIVVTGERSVDVEVSAQTGLRASHHRAANTGLLG
jgi:hypothetical protein